MGSKFILIILLSKFLSVDHYGEFNLIITTITISIYLLGLDFYNFAIRDILTNKKQGDTRILNTFYLYVLMYIIFFIISFGLFQNITFIKKYFILFFIIAITEHFTQEIYRLQIAFKRITIANSILFFRVFGYSFSTICIYYFQEKISISTVLSIWTFFNITALIIGLIDVLKGHSLHFKLEKSWIINGLKTSMFFFIATFFLKILEYANRYIIAFFSSEFEVGIFSFYSNISIIITVYINTIVTSYELPVLIENSLSEDIENRLLQIKNKLITQSIICFLLAGILMLLVIYWQNKPEYNSYVYLFLPLGISSVITNISLVYYFKMFVKHHERGILFSTLKSFFITFILAIPFIKYGGLLGASFATLIGAILLYIFRKKDSNQYE